MRILFELLLFVACVFMFFVGYKFLMYAIKKWDKEDGDGDGK